MSIALYLKNNLKNIPPSLGKIINIIPYHIRPGIGRVYQKRKEEIQKINTLNSLEQNDFVFRRIQNLVNFAYRDIKFYKNFYDEQKFHPDKLKGFNDIQKIPIITKDILKRYDLEDRSCPQKNSYVVNTGGSSGEPFSLYIQPDSMGHEWAHMHTVWSKLGYKHTDLKIVFGGRSDVKRLVEYDVVRNHFSIDIYAPYAQVCEKLKQVASRYKIRYLHGYPSSIYDFAAYCEQHDPEAIAILRKTLKGAFLGSEFPHTKYRDLIEKVFNIPTISWYGHTERAILAYERKTPFVFEPFLSYGFTEAISNGDGGFNLVGTSYYSYASPLIRYDTEDIVTSPVIREGILESFQIKDGRSGEFVIDNGGKKVNLTALIFGRHHELFNYTKFIQVGQTHPGKIIIYFVSENLEAEEAHILFDANNLNFDLAFKRIEEPIRSISGKVGLLVK